MKFPSYKFELYRASRVINASEAMDTMTSGRSTGYFGTGVYFYRTEAGAKGFADTLNRYQEGVKVHSSAEPLHPYQMSDFDAERVHEFSKALINLAYIEESRIEHRGLTKEQITRRERNMFDAELNHPINIHYNPADVMRAVEKTGRELANKDWNDRRQVSQPLNNYMRAKGYDAVVVEPNGRFDNSSYGSVYFVEDFRQRFPGVLKEH